MIMLSLPRLLCAASLLVLFWSPSVLAAAVTFSAAGDKSYSIQGSDMDGVAGIQLDITYDEASLTTPTITQGGLVAGAILAANTTRTGTIKIAIISSRAFSKSGEIAKISFATRTGSGGITSLTSSMIDSKGAALVASKNSEPDDSANFAATPPLIPSGSQPTPAELTPASASTRSSTTTRSTKTPTHLGTISQLADMQQQTESQPAPTSTRPIQTDEAAASGTGETPKSDNKPIDGMKADEATQFTVYKGVLDRFKQYRGSKNLSEVARLFDKRVAQAISQYPIVVLSNGQSKATITIDFPGKAITSPNFAANGGTLVSFRQNSQMKKRWIAEVLPEAGLFKVTVTIIAGAEAFEFPLNVALPVKTTLAFDESGWNSFLKEVGTNSIPLHDFNNDGVRNYIDEYIFVANYLSNRPEPVKPASSKISKK